MVNQYFPPDTSATAAMAQAAAQAFTSRGHQVTVLAGRPSYDPAERRRWRPLQADSDGDVRVVRVGSSAFDRRRMAGRLANYATYGLGAAPVALARRADVVVGMTDPPFAGVLAGAAAAAARRPFVYWVQDVHPEFPVATGDLRPGWAVQRWRDAHRWALRRADRVVTLGDDMARRVTDAGARPDRVVVVRSGADVAGLRRQQPDDEVTRAIRARADLVVLHAGNLGLATAWRTLVAGVCALDDPGVRLVFVGGGSEAAAVRAAAGDDDRIACFDYWPADKVGAVLAAADLHAVSVRRGLEGLVLPSRLYGVLAAGRPVLALADEASDVVGLTRRLRCGVAADPDEPASVTAALAWARDHPDELRAMGERAAAVSDEFDRPRLMAELADLVEAVAR